MANRADTLNVYVDADTRKLRQGYKRPRQYAQIHQGHEQTGDSLNRTCSRGRRRCRPRPQTDRPGQRGTQLASDFDGPAAGERPVRTGRPEQSRIRADRQPVARRCCNAASRPPPTTANCWAVRRDRRQSIDLSKSLVKLSADLIHSSNQRCSAGDLAALVEKWAAKAQRDVSDTRIKVGPPPWASRWSVVNRHR